MLRASRCGILTSPRVCRAQEEDQGEWENGEEEVATDDEEIDALAAPSAGPELPAREATEGGKAISQEASHGEVVNPVDSNAQHVAMRRFGLDGPPSEDAYSVVSSHEALQKNEVVVQAVGSEGEDEVETCEPLQRSLTSNPPAL